MRYNVSLMMNETNLNNIEGKNILQKKLSVGNVVEAIAIKKKYSLGSEDFESRQVQDAVKKGVFSAFSRGDIADAHLIYKKFFTASSEDAKYEMTEIVRQAMHAALTRGAVSNAVKIRKLFKVSKDLSEQIVKQAVLSCFYTDNFDRILAIHEEIKIPKEIADEIIAYCISWKKTKSLSFARRIFTMPEAFLKFTDFS
jgi:hypothetical protein